MATEEDPYSTLAALLAELEALEAERSKAVAPIEARIAQVKAKLALLAARKPLTGAGKPGGRLSDAGRRAIKLLLRDPQPSYGEMALELYGEDSPTTHRRLTRLLNDLCHRQGMIKSLGPTRWEVLYVFDKEDVR